MIFSNKSLTANLLCKLTTIKWFTLLKYSLYQITHRSYFLISQNCLLNQSLGKCFYFKIGFSHDFFLSVYRQHISEKNVVRYLGLLYSNTINFSETYLDRVIVLIQFKKFHFIDMRHKLCIAFTNHHSAERKAELIGTCALLALNTNLVSTLWLGWELRGSINSLLDHTQESVKKIKQNNWMCESLNYRKNIISDAAIWERKMYNS